MKKYNIIHWIEGTLNLDSVPDTLSKEQRDLILGYCKNLESFKSTLLDHISKL